MSSLREGEWKLGAENSDYSIKDASLKNCFSHQGRLKLMASEGLLSVRVSHSENMNWVPSHFCAPSLCYLSHLPVRFYPASLDFHCIHLFKRVNSIRLHLTCQKCFLKEKKIQGSVGSKSIWGKKKIGPTFSEHFVSLYKTWAAFVTPVKLSTLEKYFARLRGKWRILGLVWEL